MQSVPYALQYWRHVLMLETPFSLPFLMYTSHTSGVLAHTFFVTDPVLMPLAAQRSPRFFVGASVVVEDVVDVVDGASVVVAVVAVEVVVVVVVVVASVVVLVVAVEVVVVEALPHWQM